MNGPPVDAAETAEPRPPRAGRTQFVIDPDLSQLAVLRADVAAWLAEGTDRDELRDRAVLATSELAHLALERAHPGHPVVVELRRTHSLLAVEVTCHLGEGAPIGDIRELVTEPDLLDLRVLETVADRVSADAGGRRVTLTGSIYLAPRPSGPGTASRR